jgi:hypothetical protein
MRDAFGIERADIVGKAWNPIKAIKGVRAARKVVAAPRKIVDDVDDPFSNAKLDAVRIPKRSGSDDPFARPSKPAGPSGLKPAKPKPVSRPGPGGKPDYRYGGHYSAADYVKASQSHRAPESVTAHFTSGGRATGSRATTHVNEKGEHMVTLHHNNMPAQSFRNDEIHAFDYTHRR